MQIGTIEGCTRTIGEAQGYLGLPLRDIIINDTVSGPGTHAMESAWYPTPEQVAAILAEAPVILRVVGTSHPPVMLDVESKVDVHMDDVAVVRFAAAMREKLAAKRAEGFGGWEDFARCSAAHLSELLRILVDKGDPLDVVNVAMMLLQRGETILPSNADHDDPRVRRAFQRGAGRAKP